MGPMTASPHSNAFVARSRRTVPGRVGSPARVHRVGSQLTSVFAADAVIGLEPIEWYADREFTRRTHALVELAVAARATFRAAAG